MTELAQFHFLRPGWLALMLPAVWLVWSITQHQDTRAAFRGIIDERLLDHLLTRPSEQRGHLRPVSMMAAVLLIGILALAGPAWQREAAPFTEDQAALAIVLEVTPEMLSEDIQPSRLRRAVQKIHDLLELRPGTKNALIAYAGSAHLVMPLTTDAGLIESFASELEPDLMPLAGNEPARAIALAQDHLAQSGLPGSIVLMTSAIDPSQDELLKKQKQSAYADVHILAIAAGPEVIPPVDSPPALPLNMDALSTSADAVGGSLTVVSIGATDVQQLDAAIKRSFANAPLQEGSRWRDGGYYLLPLLALLLLSFFRHGGAVALDHKRRAVT